MALSSPLSLPMWVVMALFCLGFPHSSDFLSSAWPIPDPSLSFLFKKGRKLILFFEWSYLVSFVLLRKEPCYSSSFSRQSNSDSLLGNQHRH
jgi:hypothetical protein